MTYSSSPFRTGPSRQGPSRQGPSRQGRALTRGMRRPNREVLRARGRRPGAGPVRDPDMDRVALTIEEFGLHLVHVGERCDCAECATAASPAEERFGYTVGLTERHHPELLVRGLAARETAELLNGWGGAVLAGDVFDEGHILCEGPSGRRWELVAVPRPVQELVWAARYYGRDQLGHRPPLELVPLPGPCLCAACG